MFFTSSTQAISLTTVSGGDRFPDAGTAERRYFGRTASMHIATDEGDVSWTQVAALFSAVGWGNRDPADIKAAFSTSTFKAFAWEGDELIGLGRTIDDGKFYATVVDVVVSPAHQRMGVGRAIVDSLTTRLQGFLVVTLTAAPDAQKFYRKLGWRRIATGMMLPRSTEQARRNGVEED